MTSVPPVNSTPAPAPAQGGGAATGDAAEGQVTSLPPSLSSTDRAIVLRGEVQAVKQDGTVTIATPRGPVDVKLQEPLPAQGQRVEVTLQAGSPPAQASVRNIQQQTLPPQPQPLPAPAIPQQQAQKQSSHLPAIPLLQEQGQTIVPRQIGLPGQIPAQPQTTTPTASTSQPGAPAPLAATDDGISPQGLLNFLKSSLQSVLKTPLQNGELGAQRPLQLGQLVRLIPTPGQTPVMPQTSPALSTMLGNQPSPQLRAGLQLPLGNLATPALQAPVLAQPSGTLLVQSPSFMQTMQNAQGTMIGQPVPPGNAGARILLPMMPLSGTATPAGNIPPVQTTIPALGGLGSMVNGVMPDMGAAPRMTNGISAPTQILPQMQTPMIDARLSGTMPMISSAAQNPGMATLLHGTPGLPVMFAQVAGQTAQGLPIIQMPVFSGDANPKMVTMTLQFPTKAMAPGTWVRMDVMQTGMPMAATTAQPMAMSAEWESLDELLTALRSQPQAQAAAALAQNAFPKPGSAAFTAPVMMFLAAARGGDVSGWLGERVTDSIRNMRRSDILSRLSGAMAAATHSRDDTAPTTEWKTIQMPMMGQDHQLSQIHLHYRSFEREGDGPEQNKKQTGARFVLDLSLTRIGPLQIDGLSVGQQLDVTLRSEQSFSPSMREALRAKYTDALGGIGFSGQLNFKADGEHKGWVDFRENDTPHATARA